MKTSELIGPALDWAVAKCEGDEYRYMKSTGGDYNGKWWWETRRYSTDWSQGGPIIEQEKLSVEIKPHGYWMGSFQYNYAEEKEFLSLGPTPLIAAMRAFVASRLGDEVEIPEELL